MSNPPAPTSKIESDDNTTTAPPPNPLPSNFKDGYDEAGLTQADKEANASQKQLAECEDFTMKLDNEYYNHHKILIELITESKKLLIKYKTGNNEYYYLGEYIGSILDKPNCNNPSKPYKDYKEFLKDYRPTLKVKLDEKEEEIQLMDFQSVDGLKESIIPFNSGEKYLGDKGRIVGLKLPPVKDPKKRPSFRGAVNKVMRSQSQVREVNTQERGDEFDKRFGGKKRKKKNKKKRNNKTNRRKKKKNGTKKKRN